MLQTPHSVRLLVEKSNDFPCNMLPSSLLVVHDTSRSCEDDVSELTRRKKLDNPFLEVGQADVISWGDDPSLVQPMILFSCRIQLNGL